MCAISKLGLDALLNIACYAMGLGEGHTAIHTDMDLNGYVTTYTAGAEVVWS